MSSRLIGKQCREGALAMLQKEGSQTKRQRNKQKNNPTNPVVTLVVETCWNHLFEPICLPLCSRTRQKIFCWRLGNLALHHQSKHINQKGFEQKKCHGPAAILPSNTSQNCFFPYWLFGSPKKISLRSNSKTISQNGTSVRPETKHQVQTVKFNDKVIDPKQKIRQRLVNLPLSFAFFLRTKACYQTPKRERYQEAALWAVGPRVFLARWNPGEASERLRLPLEGSANIFLVASGVFITM